MSQPLKRGSDRLPAGPARPAPETMIGAALDRFGTDRLGGEHLETDRLLAVAHRPRSPEVRLQAALRADAGRILANWIVRIANLPVYRARPDLALDQLMDGLPALVHAALQATATPDPAVEPEPSARAAEVAAEHGRRRAAAGFPVGAVLTEFRELHAEVLGQLWRVMDAAAAPEAPEATAGTPRALLERLAAAVGEMSAAAADAWAATGPGGLPAATPAPADPAIAREREGRRR
jgi:hypothetical protein